MAELVFQYDCTSLTFPAGGGLSSLASSLDEDATGEGGPRAESAVVVITAYYDHRHYHHRKRHRPKQGGGEREATPIAVQPRQQQSALKRLCVGIEQHTLSTLSSLASTALAAGRSDDTSGGGVSLWESLSKILRSLVPRLKKQLAMLSSRSYPSSPSSAARSRYDYSRAAWLLSRAAAILNGVANPSTNAAFSSASPSSSSSILPLPEGVWALCSTSVLRPMIEAALTTTTTEKKKEEEEEESNQLVKAVPPSSEYLCAVLDMCACSLRVRRRFGGRRRQSGDDDRDGVEHEKKSKKKKKKKKNMKKNKNKEEEEEEEDELDHYYDHPVDGLGIGSLLAAGLGWISDPKLSTPPMRAAAADLLLEVVMMKNKKQKRGNISKQDEEEEEEEVAANPNNLNTTGEQERRKRRNGGSSRGEKGDRGGGGGGGGGGGREAGVGKGGVLGAATMPCVMAYLSALNYYSYDLNHQRGMMMMMMRGASRPHTAITPVATTNPRTIARRGGGGGKGYNAGILDVKAREIQLQRLQKGYDQMGVGRGKI
eukprot:jgi/Bigna1/129208/aug1.8_g3916